MHDSLWYHMLYINAGVTLSTDEYLLDKDVDVALWMDYQTHRGETPLREVCGGDFFVITKELLQNFDNFKKDLSIDLQQRSVVPLNEIMQVLSSK